MKPNTGNGHFPSTAWSMIAGLRGDEETLTRSLEALARSYWSPIYSFLRRALRIEAQEAEDVTQSFLVWLVEGSVLRNYDPARGAFRPYLKTLLRNFARNHWRNKQAKKRGGGVRQVSLELLEWEDLQTEEDSPEAIFDQAWAEELIGRATARLRDQMSSQGKEAEFAIFEAYEFAPAGTLPTYASVAKQLEVSPNTVRHQLNRIRELLRVEIRAELRNTVRDADQLEREWQELLG